MPTSSALRSERPDAVIRPRSGVEYTISYSWRGEPNAFTVKFSDDFEKTFLENDARLDLSTGEVIYKTGRRQDLMASREKFVALTGVLPPPFLFRWPLGLAKPFVVPKSDLWVDWDIKADRAAFELPRRSVPIFTCLEAPYLGASLRYEDQAFSPLTGARHTRVRRTLTAHLDVVGSDAAVVQRATRLVEEVCGKLMLKHGIKTPTQLIVVPPGKHFSALPEAQGCQAATPNAPSNFDVSVEVQKPFSAATLLRDGTRSVFLPYDDLLQGAHSCKHELYHLMHDEFLQASAKDLVTTCHQKTVERAGPFARPYGYLANEFLATLGEVFGGAFGEVGQAWLAKEHPRMRALLFAMQEGTASAGDFT